MTDFKSIVKETEIEKLLRTVKGYMCIPTFGLESDEKEEFRNAIRRLKELGVDIPISIPEVYGRKWSDVVADWWISKLNKQQRGSKL